MRSFIEWLDNDGFYIKSDWDEETNSWISHSRLTLDQWQRDIMEYLLTIDPETGTFPFRTMLLSMIKKSGKTTIGAAIGAWYAECGPDNSEIYVIANDVKQAQQRMFEDIKYHAMQRREEPHGKEIWGALLSEELRLHNGTYIQVLARVYTSAAGSRQGLTLWDELWGYCEQVGTKCLNKDLEWVNAEDLKVGDEIVAFDEYATNDRYRSWRGSTILSTGIKKLPAMKVSLVNGDEKVDTPEHKLLARRGRRNEVVWVEVQDLKPGDRLMKVLPVWEESVSKEAGYLGELRPSRLLPKFVPEMLGRMTAIEWVEVSSVEETEDTDMVLLSTSSETYLTDGYCAHNTSERSRRMWEEMTLPPTVPHPMKVVVTYAGYKGESKLLWEMYQKLVLNGKPLEKFKHLVNRKGRPIITHIGRQFALWDDQPRMVWQTKEYYREEKESLRPMKFLQLHRNEWVTSEEAFIPENFYTRAIVLDRPLLYDPDSEFRKHPISIGVDIGIKHDDAAIVGTYYDPKEGKCKQAFHDIWKTDPEYPLDIEHTVENKLVEMNELFNIVAVLYDPYQFHRSATTLKTKGLPMIEYAQSESNMTAASQNLYDLYKTQRIEHYSADDMEEQVTLAAAKNKGRGFRLVKDDESGAPNDAAIALAMSAFDAVKRMGVDTSVKVVWESPFSDFTGIPEKSSRQKEEEGLPFALRSN